jgi:hypothetical protein
MLLLGCWFCGPAQVKFEKGYFIDNDDAKIECLIRNIDWKNNPRNFEYKKSQHEEAIRMDISQVKEFAVDNMSKYVRKLVKIDRSGDNLNQLTSDPGPLWSEEEVFLYVLQGGRATLYSYYEGNLARYFYRLDGPVEPLIYKRYLKDDGVAANFAFRNELWANVRCKDATFNSVKNLSYDKSSLIKYFQRYNECNGSDKHNAETVPAKRYKNLFHLKIAPGIESIGGKIWNTESRLYGKVIFGRLLSLRCGLEAELILPYNKNKWGIVIEPTYQYFHAQKEMSSAAGDATIQYNSIELPAGLRHYFFLTDKSKLFVNGFVVTDFAFNSFIKFENDPYPKKISSKLNTAFGAGFDINNLSLELRYTIDRNIMSDYLLWQSHYNKLSLILRYKIF